MRNCYYFAAVFALALTCVLPRDTQAYIWPCESETDCTAEGSTCSSETGSCVCNDFESLFSSDYSKCLKTSLFGDACEESSQCNLMPSGASCKSGVCDCADGLTYVRGRCRLLKSLDESCETDFDCYFAYDRESVSCQNQVCKCANGYYNRYGNICRRKSMEIDDACVVDSDCDEIGTNVKCSKLTCQYVDEIRSDLTLNNKIIRSNGRHISHKLKTEPSTASEGYSQISKSSKSEIGKDSRQVYENGDVTDLTDTDIEVTEETNKKVGTENETIFESKVETVDVVQNKTRLREIAVQTSIEAFELKPLVPFTYALPFRNVGTATASTSTSSRRPSRYRRRPSSYRFDDEEKTFSTLSNTDDDAEDRKYGSSCTENGKTCTGLSHSICSNNICYCRSGYYPKNGKCFAELGEIAESLNECEHTFDELTKKCYCQTNYFYERSLRACRKPIQYHLSCTSNSQCSPFGASYCHPEVPRRCKCDEYAEYDQLQQMCVYKQGLGAQCESSSGCPVDNSVCSNNVCVCKDKYVEKDNVCVAGIGATCNEDTECVMENSACGIEGEKEEEEATERTCQCKKGFVHFKDECLKEAENIDEVCIEDEQCEPLLATCVDKKCACTSEQHFKNGVCIDKKAIGDGCSRASECYAEKDPENVECRNSVCQCKFNYEADEEQKICIKAISKKNSSGRPSALKIITFLLIGSAFLITSAALKQAYY